MTTSFFENNPVAVSVSECSPALSLRGQHLPWSMEHHDAYPTSRINPDQFPSDLHKPQTQPLRDADCTLQKLAQSNESPAGAERSQYGLVNVQPALFRCFDISRCEWGESVRLSKQIQCSSEYSSCAVLDDGTVFCCGGSSQAGFAGRKFFAVAYTLCRDGTVTDLPSMNRARGGHGIIFIDSSRTVYVFGSYAASSGIRHLASKTCEKLCLNKRPLAWEGLSDMREGRSFFNPCLYFGDIYLCGRPSHIMEVFSVQQEQFVEPFDICLPTNRSCCLFVRGEELVVHSYSWVMTFRKGQGTDLLASPKVAKSPAWEPWINTQPVLDKSNNLVYFICSNRCFCVNADSGVQSRSAVL